MKKTALALICCLTINSSSSIIAMAQQTDLKEGDTLYSTSDVNYTEGDANRLELRKKATPLGNDKYEIQLDVSGTAKQEKPPTADIVIVIDRSSSMVQNGSNKLKNTELTKSPAV